MKKILAALSAIVMLTASLTSCSDSNSTDTGSARTQGVEGEQYSDGITNIAAGYIGDTANGGNENDVVWRVYSIDGENENGKEAYLEISGKNGSRMKSFTWQGSDMPEYYQYRDKIGTITIKNVSNIGDNAFCDIVNAHHVKIDSSVTEIGKRAFKGCENLVSVNSSPEIKKLGDCAFQECASLQTVISMASVYCKGNSGAVISEYYSFTESLTDIGEKAFDGCTSLTLHDKQGSKAEEYTKQNNIKFETVQ